MQLRIHHHTRYDYAQPVPLAQHIAYLQPLSTAWQAVLEHRLTLSPQPAVLRESTDAFGNAHCYFSQEQAHQCLAVDAYSRVHTQPPWSVHSTQAWEQAAQMLRYSAHSVPLPAALFTCPSPMVDLHARFADYARASFAPGQALLAGARDVMERVHREFVYESLSTQVHTPVLQAFEQRKGVCQDFAHILLACLRSMGLAARYVSGYLLTQPPPGQPRLIGSDASHAWVAVYVPDLDTAAEHQRWVDLDPTNCRWGWGTPGEDYVTVAVGRDFSDVSPLRGVIHGGGAHRLQVGVTVEPVPDGACQSLSN